MEDIEQVIGSWILEDEDRAWAIKVQGFSVSMKESTVCIRCVSPCSRCVQGRAKSPRL